MKPAAPTPTPSASIEQGLAQAIALYNAGRKAEAQALCDALLAAAAGHPALHQLRARLCLDAGDTAAATTHAERSLRSRPGHEPSRRLGAQAWFLHSLRLHDTGDRAGEADALRRAVALWPAQVEAWVNLGICAQRQGRIADAMACYGNAYRQRPDCFGRIANALCAEPAGALWLDLQALRAELRAQPASA